MSLKSSESSDPFSNSVSLSTLDYAKCILGTIVILPVRALTICTFLASAWLIAKIGLIGLASEKDLRHGWRQTLRKIYSYFALLVFWSAGFRIRLKGRQASRAEAPILVGAPHSSFLEALVTVMCQASPVSRHENKNAFLISACQKFYETIFVDRLVT